MVPDVAIHGLKLDIELLPVQAPGGESVRIARSASSSLFQDVHGDLPAQQRKAGDGGWQDFVPI